MEKVLKPFACSSSKRKVVKAQNEKSITARLSVHPCPTSPFLTLFKNQLLISCVNRRL